ncbi:MAG: Anthranilate phosphoribosyltransferase [Alphaproteobacteria bacterium MarineAlpha9_Bin3]|nr:MAG: Anthranilate phosphoribosyltransferase [Alphaproteobacteria bacterium MarineAlpha9_Bin3]|tara:strand:- start:28261 stop:29277 length:1017 start_codon:yes stop_codon:yes gene_type:complete
MSPFNKIMPKILINQDLSIDESEEVFEYIISGSATEIEIAAFLASLSIKGPCSNELIGAVNSLKPRVINPLESNTDTIDIVGTGGDGLKTYNISTAVAFIVAAAGLYVAKHGNTAVSSKSGASDVLTELGININIDNKILNRCLKEAKICFLFAPNFNKAFKNVAKVRKELSFRTIFNLLGPLLNPVRAKRQLLGVFSDKYLKIIAETLKAHGSKKAWVVNGYDGMDEITLTGNTKVAELANNEIKEFDIDPLKYNFKICSLKSLQGGTPKENAKKMINLFDGEQGSYRNIVILNSAATFLIGDKVKNFEDGIELSKSIIDSGKALDTLNKLKIISNQ